VTTVDEAREFIRNNHRGVLATRRADGRPQLSPVIAAVDDAGKVVVSTRETAMKTHNLRRDPHASLVVLNDGFFGEWIQIDGMTEIVSLPEAMEPLVDYYRRLAGEHKDWEDYRSAMERERRVLVRLTIESAGPDRFG